MFPEQQIRMADTEDWSNDAEISALKCHLE